MKKYIDIISLNRDAWNKLAKRYEKDYQGIITPLFEYFCKLLPKGGYILDIGLGTGLPYAKLFIERGFKVLGIDISAEMINIATKNVPTAEFKEISMTNLDYKREFDGIFSSFSMLLLDPILFKETAQKIVQALKEDGIFYLSLNEPWHKGNDIDKDVIIELYGARMYSRPYFKEEILKIFKPLGMELLKYNREIITSKLFGKENNAIYIFRLK